MATSNNNLLSLATSFQGEPGWLVVISSYEDGFLVHEENKFFKPGQRKEAATLAHDSTRYRSYNNKTVGRLHMCNVYA